MQRRLSLKHLRLSKSRFCTPQKYKGKNSKVGNFALRNSYVKCVLKLNWHGADFISPCSNFRALRGALQSILCSHFSFHLSTPCWYLIVTSHIVTSHTHCHVALSSLPSVCVGLFFIAFSVSYPTLALSSLPSVCVGPFSIAFSVTYPQ